MDFEITEGRNEMGRVLMRGGLKHQAAVQNFKEILGKQEPGKKLFMLVEILRLRVDRGFYRLERWILVRDFNADEFRRRGIRRAGRGCTIEWHPQ